MSVPVAKIWALMLINCCKKIDKFSLSRWATISSNRIIGGFPNFLEIARELVDEYKNDIESINTIIEDIEEKIKDLNHPHISGSGIN